MVSIRFSLTACVKALSLLVLCASALHAQAIQPKCSTHSRQFAKAWTWLESNMCADDYNVWYVTHQAEINRPFYKDWSFWTGEGIIASAWIVDTRATNYTERYVRGPGYVDNMPYGKSWNAGMAVVGIAAETGLNLLSRKFGRKDPSRFWRTLSKWGVPAVTGAMCAKDAADKYRTGHGEQ